MPSTNIQLIGIVLIAVFSSKLVESIDSIHITLDMENPEDATYGGENILTRDLSRYHKKIFHLENGESGWNSMSDALNLADELYPESNDGSSDRRSVSSNIRSHIKSIRIVNKTSTDIELDTQDCTVISRRIKCKFNGRLIGEQQARHTGLPVFVYGEQGIKYDLFPSVNLHIAIVKTNTTEVPFHSDTDYVEIDKGGYRVQYDYAKADMKPVTTQMMHKPGKSGKKVLPGKLFARQTVGYVEIIYTSKAVFTVVKTSYFDYEPFFKKEILAESQVPDEVTSVETLFLNVICPYKVKIYNPETNEIIKELFV